VEDLGEEGKKMEYKIGGNLHAIELKLLNLVEDAALGLVLHHLFNFFLCFLWYYFVSTHPYAQTYQHGHSELSCYHRFTAALIVYFLICDTRQRCHCFFSVIWVSKFVEVKFHVTLGCVCWTQCCPFFKQ
jgi:hypothetical protein